MTALLSDLRYAAMHTGSCKGPYLHYADVHRNLLYNYNANLGAERISADHSAGHPALLASARSPRSSSQYHESCQPKALPILTTKVPLTQAELRKADRVSQDTIWKQSVDKEQKGLKKWESAYSYLTEYDSKGNPVEKTVLPESYEQFQPGPVPLTNSGHYGSRIGTQQGQKMLNLEFQLARGNKKRKLDTEMICY